MIMKFKAEYEQSGSRYDILKSLSEQMEEQKNIYQSKFNQKSKDLE